MRRSFLRLICYLRVGPGFWGEGGQGRGGGGEEIKGEEKKFLGIFFPPRVCDQVAALAEGLSTDYALVRLFP